MDPLSLTLSTLIDAVPTAHEETSNAALLRIAATPGFSFGEAPNSFALLLDNSDSMRDARPDVVRTLAALTSRFGPADRVCGVAFGTRARVFHPITDDHGALARWAAGDRYEREVGVQGSTNLAAAILAATAELQRGGPQRARRMFILTDGFPNDREATLNAARAAAAHGIRLTPFGFGGYDADYMDSVAALSQDTGWDLRGSHEAVDAIFDQVLAAQDEVAQNLRLEVEFLGRHRVLDAVTVHPTVVDHGPVRMGAERRWIMALQPVQRSEGLELLVNLRHPRLSPGRKTFARVTLRYDVPALGLWGQELRGELGVLYTEDSSIRAMDPIVKERVAAARVAQLSARALELLEATADERADRRDEASRLLGTARKIARDPQVKRAIEGTLRKVRGLDPEVALPRDDKAALRTATRKKQRRSPPAGDPDA